MGSFLSVDPSKRRTLDVQSLARRVDVDHPERVVHHGAGGFFLVANDDVRARRLEALGGAAEGGADEDGDGRVRLLHDEHGGLDGDGGLEGERDEARALQPAQGPNLGMRGVGKKRVLPLALQLADFVGVEVDDHRRHALVGQLGREVASDRTVAADHRVIGELERAPLEQPHRPAAQEHRGRFLFEPRREPRRHAHEDGDHAHREGQGRHEGLVELAGPFGQFRRFADEHQRKLAGRVSRYCSEAAALRDVARLMRKIENVNM